MGEDLSIKSAANVNNVTFRDYTRKVDTDSNPNEAGYLDFDGYLKLMVAQMSNQDFNDPMSDSEFIQQMASYSMMETIGKMNEQSQISYAASLVGKAVTVDNGATVDTGIVESVIIGDGKYELLINGSKYDTSAVKDIVDTDTYNTLTRAIGLIGTVGGEKDGGVSGEITNVLIRNGKGFVIIGGQAYAFDSVKLSAPAGSEGSDEGDGSEEEASEDGESVIPPVADESSKEEGSAAAKSAMKSASVDSSKAAMGLDDDSNWIFMQNVEDKLSQFYDENRQYLGKTNYAGIDGWSGELDNPKSTYGQYFESSENDRALDPATLARLESQNAAYANGVSAKTEQLDNGYYATKVEDVASSFSGTNNSADEEGVTVRSAETGVSNARVLNAASNSLTLYTDDDELDIELTEEPVNYAPVDNTKPNVDTSSWTYNEWRAFYSDPSHLPTAPSLNSGMTKSGIQKNPATMYEDPGFAYGVDYGVTVGSNKAYADKGGWPPAPQNRAFGYLYPAEAQLANEKGTKMYDIRFIHNTAITSYIDRDPSHILGYTITGVAFTDIGFADKGRLGEVITWVDGRQRVEIISRSGSSWYTTTGNYTIDEICNSTDPSFVENLTLFEKTIRAASRDYTLDQKDKLSQYGVWAAQSAKTSLEEEEARRKAVLEANGGKEPVYSGTPGTDTFVPGPVQNDPTTVTPPANETNAPSENVPDSASQTTVPPTGENNETPANTEAPAENTETPAPSENTEAPAENTEAPAPSENTETPAPADNSAANQSPNPANNVDVEDALFGDDNDDKENN